MNEPFPNLVTTVIRYICWDASEPIPTILFPSYLFGRGDQRAEDFHIALEIVFREMNRVDGTEYISVKNLKVPSLSVGDTVTFESVTAGTRHFVCEGAGWAEISAFDCDWLVNYVTHRDFWGTFEKTVEKSNAINS